jgi:hypothetical protein
MIPLIDLLAEADAEKDCRFDDQLNIINPVLVIMDRNDLIINNHVYPHTIELKKTVTPVLAIMSFPPVGANRHGEYIDAEGEECCEPHINFNERMHNGLAYRLMLTLRGLIGSMGIYPFRKIFERTVPQSWLEDEISNKSGYNT